MPGAHVMDARESWSRAVREVRTTEPPWFFAVGVSLGDAYAGRDTSALRALARDTPSEVQCRAVLSCQHQLPDQH